MTRIGLLDLSASTGSALLSPAYPSPALLSHAATLGDARCVYVEPAAIADASVDRWIAVVPPWAPTPSVRGPLEVIDPWATPALPMTAAAYAVVAPPCHADVDLAPFPFPVHPWVCASATGGGDPIERARAACAGLLGLTTTRLVLGDERAVLDQERMRELAMLVSRSLRERKSLVELSLRVWPEDLTGDHVIDHLSLLPIKRLDVLVGSVNPGDRARTLPLDELVRVATAIGKSGLGASTTLSIALALPGETVQTSISSLDKTLRLAAEHRIGAVRAAVWIGDGPPPRDPEDQQRRFQATHPDWSAEEYRGLHDITAVIRGVAKGIELVGPGFLPAWDSAP